MQTGHFEKYIASGAADAPPGRDEVSRLKSARTKVGIAFPEFSAPIRKLRNLPPRAD